MSGAGDNFFDVPTVCTLESPAGTLLAAATGRALVALKFTEPDTLVQQRDELCQRLAARCDTGHPVLMQLRAELDEYFAGVRRVFEVPLDYAGSSFQRSVWSLLLQIPYAATWSYLDMANRLGDPKALRAVGGANHNNPIAIVIPCHRVINANGALGGYGGGLWRKQLLLDLEAGQQRLGFG
jgi:AraC family transcriptional regulator of adaptative response/methylated-DNA-[protein]-cysteine methyltransferase